ncbi:MAG TPA: ABC transporter permease [Herpetosiphonaceae bacterium]
MSTDKTWVIARGEAVKHLRKPTFWIALFALPLIAAVIIFATGGSTAQGPSIPGLGPIDPSDLQSGKPQVGVVDQSGLVGEIPASFPPELAALYRIYPSEAEAERAVAADEIPTFYTVPADYLATGELHQVSPQLSPFSSELQGDLIELLLTTSLLDSKDVRYASAIMDATSALRVQKLDAPANGEVSERDRMSAAFSAGMAFALILYASIFSSANLLLQALIEEKENRVIEVILSSASPQAILRGKILGLGALGLLQLAIWLGLGALGLAGGASRLAALANISVAPWVWALALVCFLLGYLMYASIMAGVGAVANTMRESSQLVMFFSIPIILPLVFLSVLITQPGGTFARVLTFIPLTSPMVLVVRSVISSVPLWEIGLALALMVLTVALLQRGAARIFRATTLLAGAKPSLGALVRALRS